MTVPIHKQKTKTLDLVFMTPQGTIIHERQLLHLFSLLQVGHHDDGGCVLLPDHPPEVVDSFLLRPWETTTNTEGLQGEY